MISPLQRLSSSKKRNILVSGIAVIVVAVIGYALISSHAAGFFASVDSTNATLSGNATLASDASLPSGKAIQFGSSDTGSTGPGTWPSTPTQVCGNSQVLNGPATAPAGAITVPAGNNSNVNFKTAGATYWFAPGVHTLAADKYG